MASLEYISRVKEGKEEEANLQLREEFLLTLTKNLQMSKDSDRDVLRNRRGRPPKNVKRKLYGVRVSENFLNNVFEQLSYVLRHGVRDKYFLLTKFSDLFQANQNSGGNNSEKIRLLMFLGYMKIKEITPDPEQINHYLKKYVEMKERGEI